MWVVGVQGWVVWEQVRETLKGFWGGGGGSVSSLVALHQGVEGPHGHTRTGGRRRRASCGGGGGTLG